MKSHFLSAISLLPTTLYDLLSRVDESILEQVSEIRLRSGKPLSLTLGDKIVYPNYNVYSLLPNSSSFVTSQEKVTECFLHLCNHSVHSHEEELSEGFIMLKGGHRAGIGGRVIRKADGVMWTSDISSINIRIAREFIGVAQNLYGQTRGFKGLLICGAPNSGKTTMLRDYLRIISNAGEKVAIIDCRGEIAAVNHGLCSLDVGFNTDVITGGDKQEGIERALRVLSPHVIAFDEIGSEEELHRIRDCFNSGVKIVTTFHCNDIPELKERNKYFQILEGDTFSHFAFLDETRKAKVYSRGEIMYEVIGNNCGYNLQHNLWDDAVIKA